MHRRSYLALTAGALPSAVAGCTGSPGGSGGTSTSTANSRSTTTTSTTTKTTPSESGKTASIELREALVQPGVVLLQTDYLSVVESGGQYLLADVAVTDGEAPMDEFALQFDGQAHAPRPKRETRRLWRAYNLGEYDPANGGLLVFQLPEVASSDQSTAVLQHGSWNRELSPTANERLATRNPTFSVDVTVTSPIEVGESPRVTITIENTSDVDGRFVAALNRSGPMVASKPADYLSLPVDPGTVAEYVHDATDVTGEEVPRDNLDDGGSDLEFRLSMLDDSKRLPIEYQAADS